jgi:hypothetical protein
VDQSSLNNKMENEKLSFEGEVSIQQKYGHYTSCKQLKLYQIPQNHQEYLVKVYRNSDFKIKIISKGTCPQTSEKYYKLFLNGQLIESSTFSPKKILEITNEKLTIFPNKLNFLSFIEIKIFKFELDNQNVFVDLTDPNDKTSFVNDELLEECFHLKFHLVNTSIAKKNEKKLKNPNSKNISQVFSKFVKEFNEKISKNSNLNFTLNRIEEWETKEIKRILIMSTSFDIIFKNSEAQNFKFKIDEKEDFIHILNFMQFFNSHMKMTIQEPYIELDVNILVKQGVDLKFSPCPNSICFKSSERVEYIERIDHDTEYKIQLKIKQNERGLNGDNFAVVYIDGEKIDRIYKLPNETLTISQVSKGDFNYKLFTSMLNENNASYQNEEKKSKEYGIIEIRFYEGVFKNTKKTIGVKSSSLPIPSNREEINEISFKEKSLKTDFRNPQKKEIPQNAFRRVSCYSIKKKEFFKVVIHLCSDLNIIHYHLKHNDFDISKFSKLQLVESQNEEINSMEEI